MQPSVSLVHGASACRTWNNDLCVTVSGANPTVLVRVLSSQSTSQALCIRLLTFCISLRSSVCCMISFGLSKVVLPFSVNTDSNTNKLQGLRCAPRAPHLAASPQKPSQALSVEDDAAAGTHRMLPEPHRLQGRSGSRYPISAAHCLHRIGTPPAWCNACHTDVVWVCPSTIPNSMLYRMQMPATGRTTDTAAWTPAPCRSEEHMRQNG